MQGPLKIILGRSNRVLGEKICDFLSAKSVEMKLKDFSDGETCCQLLENVRGADVFVIQSGSPPQDKNIMELLIIIDTLKRASASRITAVLPYFPYARQDRKDRPRVPISAKLIAEILEVAGADRILAMDLHAPQIQGFFRIPVDHLFAVPVFVDKIKELNFDNLAIVSPDVGGVERAKLIYDKLEKNPSLVIINKQKETPKEKDKGIKVDAIIGEVEGKNCIIVDDIVDSAGSICASANALVEKGALKVVAFCTHPILSGEAIKNINGSKIEKIYVTDTIPIMEEKLEKCKKIEVLTVSKLFGEAIKRIHEDDSVSILFD
ncbi:MAG: ribose-phosphate pyrophosphokinase [Thermoanaerobaculia bacterium]